MTVTHKTEETLALSSNLDIQTIATTQQLLVQYMASDHAEYHIDCSMVERITTPAIQLLIACEAAATTQQRALRITPSAALYSSCATLGLQQALPSMEAAHD